MNYPKKICVINLFLFIFIKLNKNEIKICICTIGKSENLYIKEYISHYKNYGVDKIFLYDNNDINGERFEDVIQDYINDGYIEIINFRGKLKKQFIAYRECLNNNYKKYNYLIFYDIDEFIYLKDTKSLKDYLMRKTFDKCQTIQLNMVAHTDNNLLLYENKPLFERFPKKKINRMEALKSIIKGNIKIDITCIHNLNKKLKSCNGFGQFNFKEKYIIFTKNPDFKYYYIDHFSFKSTEEFINKLNKGCAVFGKDTSIILKKIGWYFSTNEITLKKINFIENYTNLNLSNYKRKIEFIKYN